MPEYAVAGLVLVLAAGAATLLSLIARRQPARQENPPYEYGSRSGHKTWVQFRIRFAVLALLFLAFDMEMVYMFPWAVVFRKEGIIAFLDMFVFIAILVAAIVYAWKEKAFDWEQ